MKLDWKRNEKTGHLEASTGEWVFVVIPNGVAKVAWEQWNCHGESPVNSGECQDVQAGQVACQVLYDDFEGRKAIATPAKNILEEANDVVKDRMTVYGHPAVNHKRTAELFNGYLAAIGARWRATPEDIPMFNMLQKMSRHINEPKRDNLVDIAGFANNRSDIDEAAVARQNGQNGPWIDTGKYGDSA